MAPAFAKSAGAERDKDSNREHLRIALGFGGRTVEKGADTGILFVDKVAR